MKKSKISFIKHGFFTQQTEGLGDYSFKENDFDLNQLKTEYSSLHQLFMANKQYWIKKPQTVAYLYYLGDLLFYYYQNDYVSADLQKAREHKEELTQFINEHFSAKDRKSIYKTAKKLKNNKPDPEPPFIKITTLRRHITTLNANRSHWGYSRGLANHAINYLLNNSWINKIINESNGILGNEYISAELVNILNKSRQPLAILGIILHTLRFSIHLSLIIKHSLQAATNPELSAQKVLIQELEKRGFIMANDLVWATVNLLITFNTFFRISASAISPIIVTFLIFDSLLLMSQLITETLRYDKRIQELRDQDKEAKGLEHTVIMRQIDLLNDEWTAQCTYYLINIFAANLLVICFTISMLFTGPLLLAGLAFFSSIGNALYNTSEEFKKYQKARISLQRENTNGLILDDEHHQKLMQVLQLEYTKASTEFWTSLAYTTGGTAFFITAAVISAWV